MNIVNHHYYSYDELCDRDFTIECDSCKESIHTNFEKPTHTSFEELTETSEFFITCPYCDREMIITVTSDIED